MEAGDVGVRTGARLGVAEATLTTTRGRFGRVPRATPLPPGWREGSHSGVPRSATALAQLALDRAIAAETGGGRDDEHQLWYVALTRARYAALIVVSDPDGGTSPVTRAIIENADPRLTATSNPLEAWLEPVREAVPCPCCRPRRCRHGAPAPAGDEQPDPAFRRVHELERRRGLRLHAALLRRLRQPACWWRPPAGSSSAPTRRAGRSSRAAAAVPRDLWLYGVRSVTEKRFWGCWRYGKADACGRTRSID